MKKFSMGTALVAACCLSAALGAGFAIYLRPASASRNSSGTYSLFTPGNPIVTGTLSNATTMNSTLSDIATALTDSLDKNGKGGMLAPLRGTDGTLAAPAFSWTSETGSGLWRNGAGDVRMSILGGLVGQWTANGLRVASGVVATPGLSFMSETGTGWYRNGAGDIRFAVSGADKLFHNASGLGIGAASPHATSPLFAVGTGPSLTLQSRSGVNARLGANLYFDGSNDKYNATGFGGYLQFGGLTSADFIFYTAPSGSGGASATTTERMKVNEGGVTIGASGTAISASIRGTASLTGGSISANSFQTVNVTVTGAAVGAECSVGFSAAQSLSLIPSCRVTGANVCVFYLANYTTGAVSSTNDTVSCRVWNP